MVQSRSNEHDRPPDRRAFIRHPADIPIRVDTVADQPCSRVADVSYGGLAFVSNRPRAVGTMLDIRIDDQRAGLDARAVVVWCQCEGATYRVGVRFLDPEDAFRSRLVQQMFAIERFRREFARSEGREVSREEAAREWVRRHAGDFPDP